jgi:carbon storage regulator
MMLVVTRKVGESIRISDNISVTVADVRGGRVRISIDAPREIPIARQECLLRQAGKEVPQGELASAAS